MNHVIDRSNGRRFPDPQLAAIARALSPGGADRVLFLYRGWLDAVDYDLLQECLERKGESPVRVLMDDIIVPGGPRWPRNLRRLIERTLASGGKVFISQVVLTPKRYAAMSYNDFFAPYVNPVYAARQEATLYRRVTSVLDNYRMEPSNLQLGSDRFLVIKRSND